MIKINLLAQKKPFKLPVVLGFDLNQINLKMVIASYIIYQVGFNFLNAKWEADSLAVKTETEQLEAQLRSLKKENKGNESVKAMLEAFGKQVESLSARSNQVEEVLKMKKNPMELLERLARSLSEDIWFNTLKIGVDDKILITGNSISYKSIGDFINASNESKFFGKTLGLSNSETKEETFDEQKVRLETFIIEGKITDYGRF
jgi:Fimbrial assembly protein (PilN)